MLLLGFGGGVLFLLFFSSSSSLPSLSLLLLLLAKVLLLLLHLITERAQFESIRDFCPFCILCVLYLFCVFVCQLLIRTCSCSCFHFWTDLERPSPSFACSRTCASGTASTPSRFSALSSCFYSCLLPCCHFYFCSYSWSPPPPARSKSCTCSYSSSSCTHWLSLLLSTYTDRTSPSRATSE